MADTCFCCGKPLRNVRRSVKVFCDDDQAPLVGQDCGKLVKAAGREGYQPPLGGPRVWWSKSWTPSARGRCGTVVEHNCAAKGCPASVKEDGEC